jgi:hypothetical protein
MIISNICITPQDVPFNEKGCISTTNHNIFIIWSSFFRVDSLASEALLHPSKSQVSLKSKQAMHPNRIASLFVIAMIAICKVAVVSAVCSAGYTGTPCVL